MPALRPPPKYRRCRLQRTIQLQWVGRQAVVQIPEGLQTDALCSEHSLVVKIPFAFWVQLEKFPAGECVVDPLQSGYLRLHSSDGDSVILHVLPNYSRPNLGPKGKLIFNRYGDHYSLREAWIPSGDFGMDFMRSKVEVEVANLSTSRRNW
jgi:hypothetical protein